MGTRKNLLLPHLSNILSASAFSQGHSYEIDLCGRDSFEVAIRRYGDGVEITLATEELADLFGATVDSYEATRGEGCCEMCYDEYEVDVFTVSNITKNWPTKESKELAKLAPKPRKSK